MNKSAFILAAALLLTACSVGPDYQKPSIDAPVGWRESSPWQPADPQDEIPRGTWWMVFHDPILDDLEKKVSLSNQNLRGSEAAYRLALATADQTRAGLFPTVGVNASQTSTGNGKPRSPSASTYDLNASASWTLDVWGKIRHQLEASEANAEASAADLANARLSYEATLATDYFALRVQDELERIDRDLERADAETLDITRHQFEAGIVSQADVLAAETQLASIKAQRINTGVRRAQLEHAIAILIGEPPANFRLPPTKTLGRLPVIPGLIPSVLLERRPDIAAAERSVAAANAQIGVAVAAWYPTISFSASFSSIAGQIGQLATAPATLWSFGPSAAETVLDFGAREAAEEEAVASYDEAVANYRQTVLNAFQQVEDNLAALRILAEQAAVEDQAVTSARKSEALYRHQYKEGVISITPVLTAETTRLQNEQNRLTVIGNRLSASVALIEALGGGWDRQTETALPSR